MDKVQIDGLTDPESDIIRSTLTILLEKKNQILIMANLVGLCPDVTETLAAMPDVAIQAAFLMNMYKRGVNLMCNQNHEEVFEIFERHPKYNIKISHLENANKCILDVLTDFIQNQNESKIDYGAELSEITTVWTKLQNNFVILMRAAYEKQNSKNTISDKKAAKYRKRVFRSMTIKDIEDVMEAWAIVSTEKAESAAKLVRLLVTEKQILKVFHAQHIDVVKQAEVIFEMIATVIGQLTDIDNLIPYLKNLGRIHGQMNIPPRTLALMKPILLQLFQQCLGFHFTVSLKQAWVRVLGFILGIMMEGCRGGGDKLSTCSVTMGDDGTMTADMVLGQSDIDLVQDSWRKVQKVLDIAVTSFYKDLISSKAEVRNLFSKSDMQAQARKLVRAFGGVIGLLSNLEELTPILEELGRRHVYYNVKPKHFKYLKLAWFRMLHNALALQWSEEYKLAWNKAWKHISSIMIASLEDALLLYVPPDPEKIKLKILINHLDKIEPQNMSYWADIWYAAFTNANESQSAAFGAEAINHERKHKTGVYSERPAWHLCALNAMETEEIYRENGEKWCRNYPFPDGSKSEWYTRGNLRGVFSQKFELHHFPFDQHMISMKFALEIDESIATFDVEENLNVRLMPFKLDMMGGTDWDVFDPEIYVKKESAAEGGSSSGKRYTHCVVDIPIARRWKHHIWDTFMPLFLIEIFAFSIYFCAAHPLAKRLQVIATLLLTLFTFKITISESMPPTPYATLLDFFFHNAKLLLVGHILSQILVVLFEENVHQINLICGGVMFAIFALTNFVLCWKIRNLIRAYPSRERGMLTQLTMISKTARMSMKQSVNATINESIDVSDNRNADEIQIH